MKNKNFIFKNILIIFFTLSAYSGYSQNVGINTTGNSPDTSAMLDIASSSRGLLIPRVGLTSLTDISTIKLPATSLLVYNTNASLSGGVGFYYNAGTTTSASWTKLVTSGVNNGSTWGLTGNASIDSTTNFIGTTDAKPLIIKTNNSERVHVQSDGKVGVGVTAPTAALHLKAGGTTPGTAPLKLTTQSAPLTTVEQGTFELVGNSLQFTQLLKRRGVAMTQNVITNDIKDSNSTTETTLITVDHGANYLEVGKCEEIVLRGVIHQTTGTGTGPVTITVYYAGISILTTSTKTGNIDGGGTLSPPVPFEIRIATTVRSTGTSGTMQVNSVFGIDGFSSVPGTATLASINTTIAQQTLITAKWSSANAGDYIICNQGRVLCIEPDK